MTSDDDFFLQMLVASRQNRRNTHWKAVPGQLNMILSSPSLRPSLRSAENLRRFWGRATTL